MQARFRPFCLFPLTASILIIFFTVDQRIVQTFQGLLSPSTTNLFPLPQLTPTTSTSDDRSIARINSSNETQQSAEQISKQSLEKEKLSQNKLDFVPQDELSWWERVNISHCEDYDKDVVYKSPFNSNSIVTFTPNIGHCGYRASYLGHHQKVVSYSLFGHNPAYFYGLPFILEDIQKIYPGWNVRIHTNPELHYQLFCPLLKKYPNLSLCDAKNLPAPVGDVSHLDPMLWRSAPLGDEQVERFIVRDTDSKLSEREAAAVAEWEASRKPIHLMRDHPDHSVPVMGGMFGIWQPPTMLNFFEKMRLKLFVRNSRDDQENLKRVMSRHLLQNHSLQHCSFWCRLVGRCSPFPTKRQDGLFVGNAMYKAQGRNVTVKFQQCPVKCRPPDHQDWLYC